MSWSFCHPSQNNGASKHFESFVINFFIEGFSKFLMNSVAYAENFGWGGGQSFITIL